MGNDDLFDRKDQTRDASNESVPASEPDFFSNIIQDILLEADSGAPAAPQEPIAPAAPVPEDTLPLDGEALDTFQDSGEYHSYNGAREYRTFDAAMPDASPDEWYRYSEEDQELDDEDSYEEEAPPPKKRPAGDAKKTKKAKKAKQAAKKEKQRRRHPVANAIAHALLVFLTMFSIAYLVAVYTDIPLVKRVRTMYIQSAMNTVNHKWMATAIIPGEIIDDVMRAQYEASAAMVGVESNWGAVDVQELPRFESEVLEEAVAVPSPEDSEPYVEVVPIDETPGTIHEEDSEENTFFRLFWELDRDSVNAYMEEHPDALAGGWSGVNLNASGLEDGGLDIETIYGDQVLALNAVDGIILIRVYLSENQSRGVLAICKDTSRLSLCPADTLGVIGQTAGRICDANGGILAITGSAFIDVDGLGNGGEISGLAICSGETYGAPLAEDSKRLELRDDDMMYIMDSVSPVGEGTRDACEFQPAMIVDGEIMDTTWNGLEPRAVLGQSNRLETMMVIVEGRYADSLGCGVEYVAAKMKQYGCVQAMNLDGGTSAIMYYDGQYVTRCSNPDLPGGRTLPTAWVYKPA